MKPMMTIISAFFGDGVAASIQYLHNILNSVQGLEQVHPVRRKPDCIPSLAKSLALSLQ